MEDRLGSFPEAWRPEPGEQLVGTVMERSENTTEYGTYPVITIQKDDGTEHAFHAFHTVAKNEVDKHDPQPGDRMGVAYHGKTDGKDYERYRVIVEHGTPRPSVVTPPAAPEPAMATIGTPASFEDDDSPF